MKKSGGQESIPRHLDMDERKRKILVGYICLFISIHCVSLFQSKFIFANCGELFPRRRYTE